MAAREWYKKWFSSPYYDLLYYKHNEQEAKAFSVKLVQYLKAQPGSKILDAGCGKGRHSKALAKMGFDVTGIDISAPFIDEAKKYETENLHFFLHDIRLPFFINYFDYVFNFFTSFGYFATRREHDNALRTLSQSLKPKGIMVIDYLNVHYAEDNLLHKEDLSLDDTTFYITRWQDEGHFFKEVKIETQNGEQHIFTEKVAKFSPGDFTEMLAYQNMQVQGFFGDYKLSGYDIKKSPRLIIIAKKLKNI